MTDNEISKRSPTVDGIVNFYKTSHFNFGVADIFCFGPFDKMERIGELLFVLFMIQDDNKRCPIREFTVILPPVGTDEFDESTVRSGFCEAVVRMRGTALDEKELAILTKRLKVVHCSDLQIRSVAAMIEGAARDSVVIVCDAAKYRDEAANESLLADGEAARLDEDAWVQHLQHLAQRAVSGAKNAGCYVVLDAGEFRPYRQKNVDVLTSVEDCGVLGAEMSNDPGALIAQYGGEWLSNIKAGTIGSVLASIDALPQSMNAHKSTLKIQMFQRAGLLPQAVTLIRSELTAPRNMSGEVRVKFARVAKDAGEDDLACELLGPAILLLKSQEWLETALALASELGDTIIEQECSRRLESLFPDSHQLHRHRLTRFLKSRDYNAILSMLAKPPGGISPDVAAFYTKLASALGTDAKPGYASLLKEVASRWPTYLVRARLTCARDAMARGLLHDALSLSIPVELTGSSARQSAWVLLQVIEQLLIRRNDKGQLGIDPHDVQRLLLELVRYLSRHPADGETRLAVEKLLSVQLTGTYGLPLIAAVALELVQKTPAAVRATGHTGYPGATAPDFEKIKPFFVAAVSWLSREGTVILGRTPLPKSLITGPVDELLSTLIRLIEYAGSRLKDGTDFKFIEQLLAVGVGTAPHTSTPNADLVLIRLVGGMYALSGRVQKARDLAEQGLQLAGDDPARVRIAWYGFADIYHRLGNIMEALVAMACALACEGDITGDQAWHEANELIRILRDLNMTAFAAAVLPHSRRLARDLGIEDAHEHRFVTMALGIRFRELIGKAGKGGEEKEEVKSLIEAIDENCKAVLQQHDELAPVATLLAQSIQMSRTLGFSIEPGPPETLERALTELGDPTASMIRTVSASEPTATEVLALAGRLEPARYSEDTGFDVRFAVIAARRLVGSKEAGGDPKVAAFAIELLADHGIKQSIADEVQATLSSILPASIEEPAQIAQDISRSDISVNLFGITDTGRLARVTVEAGDLQDVVYEPEGVFSGVMLEPWSKEFPYKYGFEAENPNLFYASMRGLGLTGPSSPRALVVMDTLLQQLPPNLLLVSDEFIGRRTAMAAAPSLSWLRDARVRRRKPGESVAWIPITTAEGADQTLAMVADRLSGSLQAHGVRLNRNPAIPTDLSGSELAIVTAHGGIVPEGRFFQVVADDANLKVTSAALSGAVRDVGLVVLFVCSAGRFDKHPMASTTVGLTKELLDRGCSTVIASPWPLHASVPAYWLPAFLDVWAAGRPVIDGNFEANKAVEKALGDSPAYCLAMTVFGDPLLVKPKRE